jgi:hypothetical protein
MARLCIALFALIAAVGEAFVAPGHVGASRTAVPVMVEAPQIVNDILLSQNGFVGTVDAIKKGDAASVNAASARKAADAARKAKLADEAEVHWRPPNEPLRDE